MSSKRISIDFPFKNNRVKFSKKNMNKVSKSNIENNSIDIPESAIKEPTSEQLEIIGKVNTYYQPWEVFKYDWKQVFSIRCEDYRKMEYEDLILKWPILTDVKIAYHLVRIIRSLEEMQSWVFVFWRLNLLFCYHVILRSF